jgi:hypothetical protein
MTYTSIFEVVRLLSQAPQSLSHWRSSNFSVTDLAAPTAIAIQSPRTGGISDTKSFAGRLIQC